MCYSRDGRVWVGGPSALHRKGELIVGVGGFVLIDFCFRLTVKTTVLGRVRTNE